MTSLADQSASTNLPTQVEEVCASADGGSPPLGMITTRLTPYTALPRRLVWFARSRVRQRLANLLIFAAVPTTLFWIWYAGPGSGSIPAEYNLLHYAAPLCAAITLIAPLAFQHAELGYERLLHTVSTDGADEGWDVPAIQAKIDYLDRLYYVVLGPLAVGSAAAVGYVFHEIRDIAPLPSPLAKLGALVVLLFVGFAAGTGIWGAIKMAIVVHTITVTAAPTWSPFRSGPQALHDLFRFAWSSGLMFSLSNVTVPALLIVMPSLSTAAKIVMWTFIVITFVGGLLLFGLTSRWLYALAGRQQREALDRLAPPLERFAERVPEMPTMQAEETVRLRNGLEAAIVLHQYIRGSTPAPVSSRAFAAATTTLVVPVLLTILQTVVSRL